MLLLLVLATVLGSVGCKSRGKTLMTLKHDGIKVTFSVNAYQLMMSRIKATLGEIQNVNSEDFWNSWIGSPAQTMDDYYREQILNSCKSYLIALYLFEKNGLELSDEELKEVDLIMDEFIKSDGGGSKSKLNSVLAQYGVNYNILKDVYIMQAKIEKLQLHLYGENASLIGDDIKTAYLKENYVHYKQIFLPFTKFVYETDANGDFVYYCKDENGTINEKKICYDTGNGEPSNKTDKNGEIIYYLPNSEKIAYNNVDGVRKILLDEDGYQKTVALTADELTALKAEKDALITELQGSSNAKFETVMNRENEERDLIDKYSDGYYIYRSEYSGASVYLNDTIKELDRMADGDITVIESDHGYFILKKYAYTEKAYDLQVNQNSWLANFNDLIITKLFTELCQPYYSLIKVNEKVYASAPSMKEVAINYFY